MKFKENYYVSRSSVETLNRAYLGEVCYNVVDNIIVIEVFSLRRSIHGSEWPQETAAKAQKVAEKLNAEGIKLNNTLIVETDIPSGCKDFYIEL